MWWAAAASVGAAGRRSIARDGGGDVGRSTYPFLRSRLLAVPPLRRVTFFQTPECRPSKK
ncbi:hypothetical protein C4K25_1012 [Pseudomonas chlororaphis]|nr:hypothetical protein C4K25_1012 [Pseudomonas chlororaphis]